MSAETGVGNTNYIALPTHPREQRAITSKTHSNSSVGDGEYWEAPIIRHIFITGGLSWTVWTYFVRYVSHAKLGQRVCQIMNSPCTLNGYNPRNDTEQHLWPHAPARCSSENWFMEILLAMRKFQVCQCCQCVGAVTTCHCSTKEHNNQTRKTCPS